MAHLKDKKHIFFDLDDTLWDFEKNSGKVLSELFDEFDLAAKLKTDFNQFQSHYRKVNLGLWSDYYKREVDKTCMRQERFHRVFNHFGYNNYEENLLFSEDYTRRTPKETCLREGCIETLSYLKQHYTLHIITNGFLEIQHIKIDSCGLREYFSHIIISEEHGLVKPEEKIFRLAETLAGCNSSEAVMIGDSFESDITGALNAGWEAIFYTSEEHPGYTGRKISSLPELRGIF